MSNDIRLTRLADCAGCGAKVGAGVLAELLADLKVRTDSNLLVGFDKSDDAAVYKVSEDLAIVQTLDFFPPIVDDPYLFGQIAACNALSDIYAMGGTPKLALNIMTVSDKMSQSTIQDILRGGYEKAYDAGAIICGGHTIVDKEPKYGMSVTGFVHPDKVLTNASAHEGDVLILTKPLGVGILTTAQKGDMVSEQLMEKLIDQMATLNKQSCEAMLSFDVHSCTDVTGFGLMGHGYEMAVGSGLSIVIDTSKLKYYEEAVEMAEMGFVPSGAYKNRAYVGENYTADGISRAMLDILFDPQTSGGLLISVAEKDADKLLDRLQLHTAACIAGYVTKEQEQRIIVK